MVCDVDRYYLCTTNVKRYINAYYYRVYVQYHTTISVSCGCVR